MMLAISVIILIGVGIGIYYCWPLILGLGIAYIVWIVFPWSFAGLFFAFLIVGIGGAFIAANIPEKWKDRYYELRISRD